MFSFYSPFRPFVAFWINGQGWAPGGGGGGGVLGPKTDGGVPLTAENWTQKDWGKNEIWGLKDRIL